MLDELLSLDKRVLIFFNGLGSKAYDPFFLILTEQVYWAPFFIFLFYLVHKKIGTKKTFVVLLFIAILIAMTHGLTNLVKYEFQRLRPVNDPSVNTIIRIVKKSSSYSFFSGHAANSMAAAVFIFKLLKPYYRGMGFLFLWPLIFAYTRIYLGLHYPVDILCGYLVGIITGNMIFILYSYFMKRNTFVM